MGDPVSLLLAAMGVAIVVVGALVKGHQLHAVLRRHAAWARRAPADFGAWLGLLAGIGLAAWWLFSG